MLRRLGLPAGLFFLSTLIFLLLPHPVAAASWQQVAAFPTTNISSFAATDAGIFAGINQISFNKISENGVYKIGTDGTTVSKIFNNSQFAVGSLVAVGNTLYAAIFQDTILGPGSVYRSIDGGVSWQLTSATPTHPKLLAGTSSVLLAAGTTGGTPTVWRSADGGTTWTRVLQVTNSDQFLALSISGNIAFASSATGFFRSSDGGTTWQSIPLPQPTKQFLGQNGNVVLAGGNGQGLQRSLDSGSTWQIIHPITFTGEQPVGPFAFGPDGTVYAGGYNLSSGGYNTGTMFVSSDNGATWTKIDSGISHNIDGTQAVQAATVAGNHVYIALLQGNVFSLDSSPPPAPVKTPLILIPGIGGSEFQTNSAIVHSAPDGHGGTFSHNYDANEVVWVNIAQALLPGSDDYFDVLRMNADGVTPLHPEVVLDGNLVPNAYGNFVKFFTDNGYTLNKDLFIYPYDWRRDITDSSNGLDGKVNAVLQQTNATQVDIVTHSMGGLVARKYTSDIQHATKVRRLVTLGAPFLGSVKALKDIQYGDCISNVNTPICFGISNSEVKDVMQNMLSAFELVPDQEYYIIYDNADSKHPFPFRDDRDMDNNGVTDSLGYDQFKTLLTNLGHNTLLFTPSEQFHTLDNSLSQSNGVDTYSIVGSGQCTLGNIREFTKSNFIGQTVNKTEESSINGDGTVPLFSASLTDASKNFNLAGTTKVYYTNQDHSGLSNDGPALQFAKNILGGSATIPSGVSTSAFQTKCKQISVLSPVRIDVYDSQGNHTGPTADGGFETNIPGSSYDEINEGKTVILPEDGQYSVKLKATDQGTFDLKVKDISDNATNQELVYADVPITTSSSADLIIDSSSQTPQLNLDENGDGTVDQAITPSMLTDTTSNDVTAPKTNISLSGTQGYNDWYKSDVSITLSAADETGGSGVVKTEYSIDGGKTVQTYTGPFAISVEGTTTLQVQSSDNAGNLEAPVTRQIKIDKTPPEANLTFNLDSLSINISGTDNLQQPSMSQSGNTVTLQDAAGNTTVLTLKDFSDKDQSRLGVVSVKYNNNTPTILPKNWLGIAAQKQKKKVAKLNQVMVIKDEEKVKVQYNETKDTSDIINKLPKAKRQTETRNGVVILTMKTDNGDLNVSY